MEISDLILRQLPSKRAQLKHLILQTALTHFNEHGIEATTIEQIRISCDASVGAIYHHFGNKDGLIAALFFMALDDQSIKLEKYLDQSTCLQQGVYAAIYSYVDWVDENPEWAKFQFAARFLISKSVFNQQLEQRNIKRNKKFFSRMAQYSTQESYKALPLELIPSLLIGSSENYCRAWLSGRVVNRPKVYREQLAEIAWLTIKAD